MKNNKSEAGKLLFMNGLTLEAIAKSLGVAFGTVKKWYYNNGWAKLKQYQKISRNKIIDDSLEQIDKINELIKVEYNGIPDKKLIEAKQALINDIQVLQKEDLAYVSLICTELIVFMFLNPPKKNEGFEDVIKKYLYEKFDTEGLKSIAGV